MSISLNDVNDYRKECGGRGGGVRGGPGLGGGGNVSGGDMFVKLDDVVLIIRIRTTTSSNYKRPFTASSKGHNVNTARSRVSCTCTYRLTPLPTIRSWFSPRVVSFYATFQNQILVSIQTGLYLHPFQNQVLVVTQTGLCLHPS